MRIAANGERMPCAAGGENHGPVFRCNSLGLPVLENAFFGGKVLCHRTSLVIEEGCQANGPWCLSERLIFFY